MCNDLATGDHGLSDALIDYCLSWSSADLYELLGHMAAGGGLARLIELAQRTPSPLASVVTTSAPTESMRPPEDVEPPDPGGGGELRSRMQGVVGNVCMCADISREKAERELLRDWVVNEAARPGHAYGVVLVTLARALASSPQNPNCGDAVELLHLAARIPAEIKSSDVPGAKALRGEKAKKRGRQRRVAAKELVKGAVLTERKEPAVVGTGAPTLRRSARLKAAKSRDAVEATTPPSAGPTLDAAEAVEAPVSSDRAAGVKRGKAGHAARVDAWCRPIDP